MLFSSAIFILCFLPIVLFFYYIHNNLTWRNTVLLLCSILFYVWGEGTYSWILFACILSNYVFGLLIGKSSKNTVRHRWFILAVVVNLGFLIYFKYFNFLVENINALSSRFIHHQFSVRDIHLPLGISFFVFQAISYVYDVRYFKIPAQKSLSKMALFKVFFPQLIAGPIVRYVDVADQLSNRKTTLGHLSYGFERFTQGLAKKSLIANFFGQHATTIYSLPLSDLSTSTSWIGALSYMFQIYFDFSGYSDMAIGLASLFGFRFKENFLHPYASFSITDFWRRWHISLSSWFRDYFYIPIGGNRAGVFGTYRNLILTFFLCGLWHGASWTFIIWGLYQGLFLILERLEIFKKLFIKKYFWQPIYVWIVAIVGWVFFRADNLQQAFAFIQTMFVYKDHLYGQSLSHEIFNLEFIVMMLLAFAFSRPWHNKTFEDIRGSYMIHRFGIAGAIVLICLFYVSMSAIASNTFNPFIYFRF